MRVKIHNVGAGNDTIYDERMLAHTVAASFMVVIYAFFSVKFMGDWRVGSTSRIWSGSGSRSLIRK